jgi:heme-degrading monooxygenase HmoA
MHLAQINIARLIAPLDDPRIAEFIAQLESINQLAENSPGFIWRLQSDQGNATELVYNDDPFVIANMSVWQSIEALKDFTYRTRHLEVFRDRKKWFQKMDAPHYCLWWVPVGHRPTLAEGCDRLEQYERNGSTPESFWFTEPHPAPYALA